MIPPNNQVVSLAAWAAENSPHWSGTAHCVGCHHEWAAVAPLGTMWLDCAQCGLPKGTPKFPFGGDDGDLVLNCSECGGEALTAYIHNGYTRVRCMGCGNELTDAFYDGGRP